MKQKLFTSNIVQKAMREAKVARLCSDFRFFKIGAVIFSNKKLLTFGYNTTKSNPRQMCYNKYRPYRVDTNCGHAEMNALRKLIKQQPNVRTSDLAIFVYRETADGHYAMAKPCPACERALRDYGIRNVYYTGRDSLVYERYSDER